MLHCSLLGFQGLSSLHPALAPWSERRSCGIPPALWCASEDPGVPGRGDSGGPPYVPVHRILSMSREQRHRLRGPSRGRADQHLLSCRQPVWSSTKNCRWMPALAVQQVPGPGPELGLELSHKPLICLSSSRVPRSQRRHRRQAAPRLDGLLRLWQRSLFQQDSHCALSSRSTKFAWTRGLLGPTEDTMLISPWLMIVCLVTVLSKYIELLRPCASCARHQTHTHGFRAPWYFPCSGRRPFPGQTTSNCGSVTHMMPKLQHNCHTVELKL